MVKFLKRLSIVLLIVVVSVITGFILSINMNKSSKTQMELISSSLFNSIKTNTVKKEDKEKTNKEEQEVEEKEQEVEEKKEEKKEETKKEEVKEVVKEEKKEVVPEVVEIPKTVETPKQETPKQETPKQETPKPSIPTPVGGYNPNLEVANTVGVSATYTGLVTAYGPDCYGCGSGETATGYNVSNGNIYYNHPTYGTIRIVAGDRSILRKVVRITGLNISSEPILAIVLDTGGDIGFNKPKGIILDLLFTSEKSSEVLNFGMQKATVEVLN